MGILGEIAREHVIESLCKKLVIMIEKYPEAAIALKELGREMLAFLDSTPSWANQYYQLFRS